MLFIIDCGYTSIFQLEELVNQYTDYRTIPIFDFFTQDIRNQLPDGFIISHAPLSIHENYPEKYIAKVSEILSLNAPVLGIGLGHQLIGLASGAQPNYSPYMNDLIEIAILEQEDLFEKLPDEIQMIKNNSSSISIPPGFQLLASSDFSINEAMKKINQPIYGVQFLIELSGMQGGIIMDNFVNISQQKLS
ncbi:MAG: hypothetical protein H3C31_05520 [Brumimicrobium sp.]|nr:hypothetical protein [Brumimicrobium sp.]MCO5268278.1 hypothetical protein [Brumimicrobium sp.]